MTRPESAYAWAVRRRPLLNDLPAVDAWEDEHSNDRRWSATLRLASSRCEALEHAGAETRQAIASIWIERVDAGYAAATLHPVDGEFVLLADAGLRHMIDVAGVLVARHYRGSSFEASHCTDSVRSSFARVHHVLVGQFYLYGRLRQPLSVDLLVGEVAQRVTQEATLFVLAHELGHAVAATQHRAGSVHWLDPERPSDGLEDVAVEIEADAFAVALCLADLWGAQVGEAELTLRILAIRLTLNTMEAVEAASLVPRPYRHLPARRRWNGIRAYLTERVPLWLLERVDELWDSLASALTFTEAPALIPPCEGILSTFARDGWIAGCSPAEDGDWTQQEQIVWQFRLPPPIVEYLIGADAVSATPDLANDHARVLRAGRKAVTEMLATLPPWLVGSDPSHGRATSGDLIEYLRIRDRWPEPFRDGAPLPIHLMAAAIHQRLNGRLPRVPETPG